MTNQILEAIERIEAKIDALGVAKRPASQPKREPGEPALCNKCGAQIVWCKTHAGKNVPLDFEPKPDGDWKLEGEKGGKFNERFDPPDVARHSCHFDTCGKVATSASDEPTVSTAPTREPGDDDIPF